MTEKFEAIYVRQSKDKKDSLSVEGQMERCRMECSHPSSALVYEDRGFSGKNTSRPILGCSGSESGGFCIGE